MSTVQVRAPYTTDELQKLYPKSLELKQAQVILRHGERTPTNVRFQNAGLPAYWSYCSAARHFTTAVMTSKDTTKWESLKFSRQVESLGKDDMAVAAVGAGGSFDTICQPGELTDLGRQTTLALGQRLRHLYIDQLNFMPSILSTSKIIYLRSTPISRALESAQQTFTGMYPNESRASDAGTPVFVVRSFAEETLFPNDLNCKRLAELAAAFGKRAADRWNGSPEMKVIQKKIGKWMPADSPEVKVDSHPRLSGVMDTINATLAHGPATRLPKEFYDEKSRSAIDKIACSEWFDGFKESNEYRTLGAGGLAADIVSRMVEHARGEHAESPVKRHEGERAGRTGADIRFGISGAHDTTLAAFLASLGAFEDERWPPFTSHVACELFKSNIPIPSNRPVTSESTNDSSTAPSSTRRRGWFSFFGGGGGGAEQKADENAAGDQSYSTARKPLHLLTEAEKAPLKDYYVRIRYNDRSKTLPGCRAPGKHLEGDESFCTLEAFKEIVDSYSPKNWREQCRQNLGKGVLDADMRSSTS